MKRMTSIVVMILFAVAFAFAAESRESGRVRCRDEMAQ